jgi:hypothetical protein
MFKKFNDFVISINEGKDEDRIQGIIDKSKGDEDKELQLAGNMAKSIDDKDKAYNRGLAAYNIEKYEIAKIFFDRAVELKKVPTPEIKATNNKVSNVPVTRGVKFSASKIVDEFKEKTSKIRRSYSPSSYGGRSQDTVGLTPYQNFKRKCVSELNITEIEAVINLMDTEFDMKKDFNWSDRTKNEYWAKDFVETLLRKAKSEDPIFFKKFLSLHHFDVIKSENKEISKKANEETFIKEFKDRTSKDDMIKFVESKFNYSGSDPILKLKSPLACFVWKQVEGQISDGMWENSKPNDHWKWIQNLRVSYDPNSEGFENMKIPKRRNYNYNSVKEYIWEGYEKEVLLAWDFGFLNIFKLLIDENSSKGRKINSYLKSKNFDNDSVSKLSDETSIPEKDLKEFIGCYLSQTPKSSLSKELSYLKTVTAV